MPYPKFTKITLKNGVLTVGGATGNVLPEITRIDLAIVALDNPARRLDLPKIALHDPWSPTVKNVIPSLAPFAPDEPVLLVGAATLSPGKLPNPFLWYGSFKIQSPSDTHPGDVTLVPHP
jgi:hypothetical protein